MTANRNAIGVCEYPQLAACCRIASYRRCRSSPVLDDCLLSDNSFLLDWASVSCLGAPLYSAYIISGVILLNATRLFSPFSGVCTLVLFYAVPAAALGTLTGIVTEEGTDKAVADAFVFATWSKERGFENESVCDWIEIATTGADGRYQVSKPTREIVPTSLGDRWITLSAYQSGYSCRSTRGGTDSAPSTEQICRRTASLAASDRLARLHELLDAASCIEAPVEQRRKLLPLYRAIFNESRSLIPPESYRLNLSPVCFDIFNALGRPPVHLVALTAEDQALISREEPGCLPILLPPARPKIREIRMAPPTPGGGSATPSGNQSK